VVLTADHSSAWRSCLVDCEQRRFTFPERSHQKHRRVDLQLTSLGPTGVAFQDTVGESLQLSYEDFEWEPMSPFEMARTEG
jgi:hypothetical protein